MRVKLEYGRTGLYAELPDERIVRTLRYKDAPPLPDPWKSLLGVLHQPTGSPPLAENSPAPSLIEAADPLLAFVSIVQHLHGKRPPHPQGISPQASIHPEARLGPDCTVMPFAVAATTYQTAALLTRPSGSSRRRRRDCAPSP